MLNMKQPTLLTLVLIGAVIGLGVAIMSFPARPLQWSTVLFGALGISIVGGLVIGLAARRQERRLP